MPDTIPTMDFLDDDPVDEPEQLASTESSSTSENELRILRTALFGKDYEELTEFKERLKDHHKYSESVAKVISEALSLRIAQDNTVANALAPTIQSALKTSIVENPQPVADALYPVMGPAIRKSISEALSQMMETFNQLLEQSFTLKSLLWRFEAWRTGRSFSEVVLLKSLVFQVEQVFLISRKDNTLLQQAALERVVTQDDEIQSETLSKIQDFIHSSLGKEGDTAELNTLKLKHLTIFFEYSSDMILAAVVRGAPPENIRRLLTTTLEFIQIKYASVLIEADADQHVFDGTQPLLQRCLKSQMQEKKSSHLPLYIVSLLLAIGLGYWAYNHHQNTLATEQAKSAAEMQAKAIASKQEKQWNTWLDRLRAEPGIAVINNSLENKQINLLVDPLAQSPEKLLHDLNADKAIVVNTQPYLSADDAIILSRTKQLLNPPKQVSLVVKKSRLLVSGKAPLEWADDLKSHWRQVVGLSQIDVRNLKTFDPNLPRLNAVKSKIESIQIPFDNNSILLSELANRRVEEVGLLLDKLIPLANKSNKSVQISVAGYSDKTGTEIINNKLSAQRMQIVKQKLIASGVSESLFAPTNSKTLRKLDERSVRFTVLLRSL